MNFLLTIFYIIQKIVIFNSMSFLMEYYTMTLFTVPGKQTLLKQGNITPHL